MNNMDVFTGSEEKKETAFDGKVSELRSRIDSNTISFVKGANLLKINRDAILTDSKPFVKFNNRMVNKRRVLTLDRN